MIGADEVKAMTQGLDYQSLAAAKEKEAINTGGIDITRHIDLSRDINEYPTADRIVRHLMKYGSPSTHIYTRDLQKGGRAVCDNMEKYLTHHGYNSSVLKQADSNTPLHVFYEIHEGWKVELEQEQRKQKYWDLGTFIHQAFLEPTRFSRVVVEPKSSLSSHDGVDLLIRFWMQTILEKNEKDEALGLFKQAEQFVNQEKVSLANKKLQYQFLKDHSGLEAIEQDHKTVVEILERNFKTYAGGILPEIVKYGKREISLYTQDHSLHVKARPDELLFSENIGVDAVLSIKSTRCESLQHFWYNSAQLKYELTEGMYQEVASQVTGRKFLTTLTLMFQTTAPYGVALMIWNPEDLELGKWKYRRALDIVKGCLENEHYPGYEIYAQEGNMGIIEMKQPWWNAKTALETDINN